LTILLSSWSLQAAFFDEFLDLTSRSLTLDTARIQNEINGESIHGKAAMDRASWENWKSIPVQLDRFRVQIYNFFQTDFEIELHNKARLVNDIKFMAEGAECKSTPVQLDLFI
jgi:hypothetical protein